MNNITFLKYRIYKNTGHKNVLEKKTFSVYLFLKYKTEGNVKINPSITGHCREETLKQSKRKIGGW